MTSRVTDDRGTTLVEVLVAVVIMGIAVVAIVGGLVTAIQMSDIHRKQATAFATARNYAEQLSRFVSGTGYASCATPAAYDPSALAFTGPTGYAAGVSSIRYWSPSSGSWASSCTADAGLQEVTLEVASTDGRATERVVVVVRKPCGQGSPC